MLVPKGRSLRSLAIKNRGVFRVLKRLEAYEMGEKRSILTIKSGLVIIVKSL